ncbi:MAG: FAD-dependent oxidoreductase [Verrucomicrobiota bacterium]
MSQDHQNLSPSTGDPTRGQSARQFELRRQIPAESGYDVVVAGGGPAGTAAAISAARLGRKVLLLEATGCLGGMGTSAMVSAWSNTSTGKGPVIGGLIREWIETLHRRGELPPKVDPDYWNLKWNCGFGFNAEGLKRLLDEQCAGAGVEVRFYTRVVEAEADRAAGRLEGVVTHDIEGLKFVRSRCFIDATGDAVLAHLVGADCWQAGRDTPGIMPPTLCSTIAGVDFSKFDYQDQQDAKDRALADGFFSQPDRHVPGLFRTGATTGILNAGHLFHTDALAVDSLSRGMVWGRELAREYTEWLRRYLDGCEEAELMVSGSLLGVRESRRVRGEYTVGYEDYQARRHFPDQIAIYCKQVDIHVYDLSEEEYQRYYREFHEADLLQPGESYGLPYGILVPRGWSNLWTAGRCSSSDVKVNGAIRDQPGCAMLGEAAGAAAAQSIATGQPANDLDTEALVATLRTQGANLPQAQTGKTMTRSAVPA